MKRIFMTACAVTTVALLSGCASGQPSGILVSDYTVPNGVGTDVSGLKKGESSCHSWFGLVAGGDASIEAAKKAGNIKTVSHVDRQVNTEIPLGIKTVYTTKVYGK